MTTGIDRLSADLADIIAADSAAQLGGAQSMCGSPIEALFFVALRQALQHHPKYLGLRVLALPDPAPIVLDSGGDVFLGLQHRVLDWPVDFVVYAKPLITDAIAIQRLAIECDDHAFHGRMKEQAARDRSRDRALQAAGFTVMRFTGTEIFRNPLGCACEVLEWCLSHVEGI